MKKHKLKAHLMKVLRTQGVDLSTKKLLSDKFLQDEELDTIRRLIKEMHWQVSLRQTRRRVSNPRGNILHRR